MNGLLLNLTENSSLWKKIKQLNLVQNPRKRMDQMTEGTAPTRQLSQNIRGLYLIFTNQVKNAKRYPFNHIVLLKLHLLNSLSLWQQLL